MTLNGAGISSGGALRNISGNNSYAGLITLGSATRINSDSGTLTLDVHGRRLVALTFVVLAAASLTGAADLSIDGTTYGEVHGSVDGEVGIEAEEGDALLSA